MNWVSIDSGNGLFPVQHQAITWTNADLLSIEPFGRKLREIESKFIAFHLRKCIWKCHMQNVCHFVQMDMSKVFRDMPPTTHFLSSKWKLSPICLITGDIDTFTVHLHRPNHRHLPKAVQRDCHWGLKNGGNSHWSCETIMQWGTRQSQSICRPTNHKSSYQAVRNHVSYPTDSPIATRLGLHSSLQVIRWATSRKSLSQDRIAPIIGNGEVYMPVRKPS